MDTGDIISLVFFGFLLLSLLGGMFGRKAEEEERPPRPTELSQSGGAEGTLPPVPQRPASRPPVAASHEQRWEEGTQAFPTLHQEEVRERYRKRDTPTYDDVIEAGDVTRIDEPRRRSGDDIGQQAPRPPVRPIAEQDLTDMPPPMDLDPERRVRSVRSKLAAARRKHPATGGDILRRTLKDPETLERAYIIKEVLDIPVGMRKGD